MARRSRTSVLKRQREAAKRARERRKQEKRAAKLERKHGKPPGTKVATRDELIGLGVIIDEPETGEDNGEDEDEEKGESS